MRHLKDRHDVRVKIVADHDGEFGDADLRQGQRHAVSFGAAQRP